MYKPGFSLTLPPAARAAYACLDGNTCPYPPAPKVRAAVMEALKRDWMKEYPEYQEQQLIERASEFYEVPSTCIAVTAGVDHAINYLMWQIKNGGLIEHEGITYSGFIDQANRYHINHVGTFKKPFDTHLVGFDYDSDVIYIANPNNPTGVLYEHSEILWLLGKGKAIIVDESYMEWADQDQSCLDLIPQHDKLIVLRGFSKAFGLAGMRVGLLFANPSIIEDYHTTFDCRLIPIFSQIAVEGALDNFDYVQEQMALAKITKENTIEYLRHNGFKIFDTDTNFILIADNTAQESRDQLDSQYRILTRTFENWPGYLRVSVGSLVNMERFCEKYLEIKNKPGKVFGEAAIPRKEVSR